MSSDKCAISYIGLDNCRTTSKVLPISLRSLADCHHWLLGEPTKHLLEVNLNLRRLIKFVDGLGLQLDVLSRLHASQLVLHRRILDEAGLTEG